MSGIIESLGLSWQEMLFYAINLVILIVAIRFLVYKPVKKIVDNRKEQLELLFVENERLNKEALELKKNHEKALRQTRQEVAKMTEEITKNAKLKSQEIIEQAQKKAQEIIQKAKKEMDEEKARALNACKQQVPIISMDIARQIVQRELNEQDHQKLIEDALSEWES
ncbi:MAG TPA: F0F1 ATP synthase subunit B [Clostridiales bacterium]|nr:F0F1 ATP synthase subunit B [Clostridiales bacterium]